MMVDWVSISFHETDKIRLVSGPGKETASQTSLREKVRARLAEGGEGVVQREREYHGATEWKLSGTPFSGTFGTGGQQGADEPPAGDRLLPLRPPRRTSQLVLVASVIAPNCLDSP